MLTQRTAFAVRLLALGATLTAFTAAAQKPPYDVFPPAGTAPEGGWPLSCGVPLPPGRLRDVSRLHVLDLGVGAHSHSHAHAAAAREREILARTHAHRPDGHCG